jgi:N-acetylglucosamine kinase-like BadF-type ATPase
MMLVLGVDAGGTASRAVVATPDGTILGRGSAGPGNPTSVGCRAARSIGTAIRAALGDRDPHAVGAGVVGVAGIGILTDPAISAAFDAEWASTGLTCPITLVGDAIAAFAAGTPAASGAVLIAGTGAVAARIEDWRIARTADGLGWLLGDEGSGLWLGLQAIRAAARSWTSSQDGLIAKVAAHTGAGSRNELVHWAGRQPPPAFAALAPLVCASAQAGDPLARRLTTDAATRLLATLGEVGPVTGPVVLAGGLLTADTPVREAVLSALDSRGTPAATSGDPATGAAWLAIRRATDLDDRSAANLHAHMLSG